MACLAAFGLAAEAACDTGLAERMHAKLHPDRLLDHERAACQPWRGMARSFVVVLPLPRAASASGTTVFDLDVLLVQQADNGNTDRATIVSRLWEPEALTEDAVRVGAIKIDGGRYALASDERAFGIRVVWQGASRANPYASEKLSLYLPRGPRLSKVLDELELLEERGEWDTNCTGNFETVRGSLSVGRTSSNGLADLVLRRTRVATRSAPQGDDCVTHAAPATFETHMARYDGRRYRVSRGSPAE